MRIGAALVAVAASFAPNALESAAANGDTRTIYLYHAHRKDTIAATFRVNGHYDGETLEKLNWFLRDWRNDEPTKMDPRLFDAVWEAYRSAGRNTGPDDPITVLSAYRCPATNAMLRRRSRAVAEHSQHMLGKAMDSTMPGLSMEKLREVAMRLQRGGVGYYPNVPFVHIDVGGVRSWPRMNYDQLVRLFPDGKTVHLPSNGKPLAGYDEAKAEIEARGGETISVAEANAGGGIGGFFARLFGGGGEDEEEIREVGAGRASDPGRARQSVARSRDRQRGAEDGGDRRSRPAARRNLYGAQLRPGRRSRAGPPASRRPGAHADPARRQHLGQDRQTSPRPWKSPPPKLKSRRPRRTRRPPPSRPSTRLCRLAAPTTWRPPSWRRCRRRARRNSPGCPTSSRAAFRWPRLRLRPWAFAQAAPRPRSPMPPRP